MRWFFYFVADWKPLPLLLPFVFKIVNATLSLTHSLTFTVNKWHILLFYITCIFRVFIILCVCRTDRQSREFFGKVCKHTRLQCAHPPHHHQQNAETQKGKECSLFSTLKNPLLFVFCTMLTAHGCKNTHTHDIQARTRSCMRI